MKVVVLLSGGLDSTVLLAKLLADGYEVQLLTFDYAQANRTTEIVAAHRIADHYGMKTQLMTMPPFLFGPSALFGDRRIPTGHADEPDDTTVPGRNLVFLAIGAAYAARHGAGAVAIAATLDDEPGYLDCRPEFMQAIDNAVSLGTGTVSVIAPFLSYDKQRIVGLGKTLDAPIDMSWSCYLGSIQTPPVPCGECGACTLRAAAGA